MESSDPGQSDSPADLPGLAAETVECNSASVADLCAAAAVEPSICDASDNVDVIIREVTAENTEGGGSRQPSEWYTFDQSYNDREMPPLSAIDRRLQEIPSCSIESLLDEEEILQEFRIGNKRLLERLCSPEGVRVLIEQVTRGSNELDPSVDSRTLKRRPWIASELISVSCNTRGGIYEAFEKPGGAELLELVWSFLDYVPEPAMAGTLAGYFCGLVTTLLLSRRTAEVTENLRRRDPSDLFELFLQRLESHSFAEVLALLLTTETIDHLVFPVEGLGWRLVGVLRRDELGLVVLEHAVLVIEAVLARACRGFLYANDVLLRQFSEPGLIIALIDQALVGVSADGCSASSAASASLLPIIVFHTHLLPADPLLPMRNHDFRLAPSSSRPSMEMAPLPQRQESGAPCAELILPSVETPADGVGDDCDILPHSQRSEIVQELCSHLPRICRVLDLASEQKECKAPSSSCCRPLAVVLFEVVALLSMLAKTGHPVVFEAALDAEVLPRCLQVLLNSPWNSLIHNAVISVLRAFADHGPPALPLVRDLLTRADLMQRVVAEMQHDAAVRSGERGLARQRVGFVGHLRMIFLELLCFGGRCPEVMVVLEDVQGWFGIILQELQAVQKLEVEALGGTHPGDSSSRGGSPVRSDFDSIAALQTVITNATDDVDLNLQDMRDLDDELDAQQALAMASALAKRRAKGVCPPTLDSDDCDTDDMRVLQSTVEVQQQQCAADVNV